MKNKNNRLASLAMLAGLLTQPSCSEKKEVAAGAPAHAGGLSPALTQVFASAPAGDAISIVQARSSAKPGDSITLQGVVMGSSKPIVEGRAAFILGDPAKLTPCNQKPDDECETPWDVCCDTPEIIKASTATIQVVDADGRVLKESIENVHGLKPLSQVTVTGTVTPASNAEVLVLNATAIKVGL